MLLLGSIGYLAWSAFTEPDTLPDPVIRVTGMHRQGDRHLVSVQVENRGTQTAAALRIVGELRHGEQVVEQSETEFAYLPGRSTREGGLYFTRPPADYRLVLGARSYQKP